ncbi:hypothetical protein ABZ369_30890, partial [Streptomyces sp. NPDC005918]
VRESRPARPTVAMRAPRHAVAPARRRTNTAAGVLLSQASYRGAGLAAPLSTVTVVNPVVAAAVGLTLFGESFRHGVAGTVLALACGVVAAGGLVLLTTERIARETSTVTVAQGGPAAPTAPATERVQSHDSAAGTGEGSATPPAATSVLPGVPSQPPSSAHRRSRSRHPRRREHIAS